MIRRTGLRARQYDLVLAREVIPLPDDHATDDLNKEVLFDDPVVVAAGTHSRWARRRHIDLAELIDAPWIMSPPGTLTHSRIAEAFQALGLDIPKAALVTLAWPLLAHFVTKGEFITGCPRSVARFSALKELPVDLPVRPWHVLIVTLKNRTLSPVVERFMESARAVTKSIAARPRSRQS
jgi:DNA-binding transcriptional LysR family regulator